ncbi:hypothetical protein [Cryobacterium lyxosi]|uniref:Small secreted hydrophilic protein n=1 Tax=Cryobacterium lyxosi TaxID=1259228 RepID=A0A4R8ZLJ2_9MICO|nr:hypothetical protein [Cryobacterium lyxosi]TFD29256.1 hypothetical protein E3T27_00585 [Cryobacterium lyxosi]
MNARSIWTRPLLWIAGAGVGAVLLVALASVLADSLAIAEQPGRSIGVPAVSVQPSGASTGAATPDSTPSAEPTSTEPTSTDPTGTDPTDNDSTGTDPTGTDSTGTEATVPSAAPEVVPAQDPVVVDDHGGDNPDHDDDIGVDDSGGSSGSGRKSG